MALILLHKQMTREALQGAGFSDNAAEIAAEANAEVDKKQGNSSAETNLHSMAGFPANSMRLQREDEVRRAVEELLVDAKANIVTQVFDGNHRDALKGIGAALHTVQDRAFHHFEPWPYSGIGDAIAKDPNYMFGHAVRDLGGVSMLGVRPSVSGGAVAQAEWTFELSRNFYFSVQGFHEFGSNSRAFRVPGATGFDPMGSGGLLTFTLGAAPGSMKSAGPTRPMTGEESSSVQNIGTQGPDAKRAAREASHNFAKEIKRTVLEKDTGAQCWEDFLKFK